MTALGSTWRSKVPRKGNPKGTVRSKTGHEGSNLLEGKSRRAPLRGGISLLEFRETEPRKKGRERKEGKGAVKGESTGHGKKINAT